MPCPAPDCKGYLSSAYKCAACSKYACPHCLVVLGVDKDPQHECDPDVVATVEQIKKETKLPELWRTHWKGRWLQPNVVH